MKYLYKMFGKEKQHNFITAALRNFSYCYKLTIRKRKVIPDYFHMFATFTRGMNDFRALMLLYAFERSVRFCFL